MNETENDTTNYIYSTVPSWSVVKRAHGGSIRFRFAKDRYKRSRKL